MIGALEQRTVQFDVDRRLSAWRRFRVFRWLAGMVAPQATRRSSSCTANHRRQLTEGPWVIVA